MDIAVPRSSRFFCAFAAVAGPDAVRDVFRFFIGKLPLCQAGEGNSRRLEVSRRRLLVAVRTLRGVRRRLEAKWADAHPAGLWRPGVAGPLLLGGCYWARYGWRHSLEGEKFSWMNRPLSQRCRARREPVLSLVPEARPPPKETCPMRAPVGLSLMYVMPEELRS